MDSMDVDAVMDSLSTAASEITEFSSTPTLDAGMQSTSPRRYATVETDICVILSAALAPRKLSRHPSQSPHSPARQGLLGIPR